jgi:hypothetical protein
MTSVGTRSFASRAERTSAFIDLTFKRLGATTSEREWTVQRWLAHKAAFELDMLIDRLENETASSGSLQCGDRV